MRKPQKESKKTTAGERSRLSKLPGKRRVVKPPTPLQEARQQIKLLETNYEKDALAWMKERDKLCLQIERRDKELHNSDKILQSQHKTILHLEQSIEQYKKLMDGHYIATVQAMEIVEMYKKQLKRLTDGEEWKPEVKAILEANKLPINLN